MKSNNFLIAIFFTIIIIIVACKSKHNPDIIPDSINFIISANCLLHDYRDSRDTINFPEMDPRCADSLILKYAERTQSLKDQVLLHDPEIDELLISGASVSYYEMKAILHAIETDTSIIDSTIYIMLAAHSSGQANMIFTLKRDSSHYDKYRYFNFTQPCPDACPWPPKK